MKRYAMFVCLLVVVFCSATRQAAVRAAITSVGDVVPGLPWTSPTIGYIGKETDGTLTVDESSVLISSLVYIGHDI